MRLCRRQLIAISRSKHIDHCDINMKKRNTTNLVYMANWKVRAPPIRTHADVELAHGLSDLSDRSFPHLSIFLIPNIQFVIGYLFKPCTPL